jgi:uncharacterized DUF497 family protein
MEIEFDPAKRLLTLEQRGLDMNDASLVFSGLKMTLPDDRRDYGEPRWITVGFLNNRMVIVIWTPRNGKTRIISMRKANDREQENYYPRMG